MSKDPVDWLFMCGPILLLIAGAAALAWIMRPTEFELQVSACANQAHGKGANKNEAYFQCWKAISKKNEEDAKVIVDQVLHH